MCIQFTKKQVHKLYETLDPRVKPKDDGRCFVNAAARRIQSKRGWPEGRNPASLWTANSKINDFNYIKNLKDTGYRPTPVLHNKYDRITFAMTAINDLK